MTNALRLPMYILGLMIVMTGMASCVLAGDPPPSVPELDPGSIGSALTVATGAFFMLRGRRAAR